MARLEWRTERLDAVAAALSGKAEAGRHFLEGPPVHCGDLLELLLDDAHGGLVATSCLRSPVLSWRRPVGTSTSSRRRSELRWPAR